MKAVRRNTVYHLAIWKEAHRELFLLFQPAVVCLVMFSSAMAELHVIDGVPQSIFVQSKYTIEVCDLFACHRHIQCRYQRNTAK